jgi:tetratricopeptide (TPR) repeat protein
LGNSYRQTGKVDKALDAYYKAITMVDKDIIRNNDSVENHVYRYYYYLYLSQLAPKRYADSALDEKEMLLEHSLDKKCHRCISKTSNYLGDSEKR